MHTSFKMLMIHHNLPYHEDHAEQLLGELFDIIYRDQGVFEKLTLALSKSFAEKMTADTKLKGTPLTQKETTGIILKVRNEVIKQNPILFASLGNVTLKPENYFEATPESKLLAYNFTQAFYASLEAVEITKTFQLAKEESIKIAILKDVISFSEKLYYQDIFFVEGNNTSQRKYIKSLEKITAEEIDNLNIVNWDELSKKIESNLGNKTWSFIDRPIASDDQIARNQKWLLEAKKSYDEMANVFKGLSLAGEQNTCMSFFPVKIELNSGECKHVCLVTTSGDVYKVGNEKNKEALVAFQKNLKRLAEKIPAQMIDKIYYEFIYHDAENGSIDVLLQQVNKGLSGQEQPLSSIKEETKIVLNDPFRACAEKKFIAYIRDCLKNPNIKSLKILGASNLRMPIIPTINHQELLDEKIKEFCQFVKTNCKDISNERMLTEVKEKIKDESEKAEKFISEQSAALLASYKKATEFVMAVYPKKWNGKNIGADLLKILARCDELLASPQEKRKVREILQQHFSFMLELHTKWIEFLELEKEESETIENSENIATFEEKKLESQTCIKKYINDMKEKITDNISKLPVNERFKNQQEFNKESEMLNNAIDRLGKKLVTIDQLIVQFKQSLKSINKKIETPNELVFLVTRSDKDNFELSSSFINCCNACVANKLPVLTWLTDLQEQKQTRLTTEVSTMVTTTTTTASRNGSADNSPSKLLATKMVKSLNISKVNNESPLKSTSPDKSKPALLLSQSPFQQSAFSPLNSCSSMNMGGKEGRKGIARQLFRKDEEPTSTEHSQLNQKK